MLHFPPLASPPHELVWSFQNVYPIVSSPYLYYCHPNLATAAYAGQGCRATVFLEPRKILSGLSISNHAPLLPFSPQRGLLNTCIPDPKLVNANGAHSPYGNHKTPYITKFSWRGLVPPLVEKLCVISWPLSMLGSPYSYTFIASGKWIPATGYLHMLTLSRVGSLLKCSPSRSSHGWLLVIYISVQMSSS